MNKAIIAIAILSLASPVLSEVTVDGFMQVLYGARIDQDNPTATEHTASETRLQLRAEHFGDAGEFFGRLDFVYDAADSAKYDWELREGYFKFQLGSSIDIKVGRQILTWGTGDLIFINDVFAKDYRSFFVGRDDQYLKAPQSALRMEVYKEIGSFSFVWTPRFEPNRLPTGRKLSYFNPMLGGIAGEGFYFNPPSPDQKFENGEFATRFNRQIGAFSASAYFYKGFYKNPLGVDFATMTPLYPKLNMYGGSIRGAVAGGILWLEGGYFDSREDRDGDRPDRPNSTISSLAGFERQIANNLTANLQWQADYMLDYDLYEVQQEAVGAYARDEIKHLLTSRWTKMLNSELVTLSGFLFWSPSDEDIYLRLSASYKYTDEVSLSGGANIFDGKNPATEFGQFMLNDNVYLKMTYGF